MSFTFSAGGDLNYGVECRIPMSLFLRTHFYSNQYFIVQTSLQLQPGFADRSMSPIMVYFTANMHSSALVYLQLSTCRHIESLAHHQQYLMFSNIEGPG
jgi:hypothetical protein